MTSQETGRWDQRSAWLGAFAWIALLGVARIRPIPVGVIEQLFLLAPLVIVPLGLRLADMSHRHGHSAGAYAFACRLQPFAAFLLVGSFCLMPGITAALLALPWLLVSGLAGYAGCQRLLRGTYRRVEEACPDVGLLYLTIGAAWLVVSRFGRSFLGFEEPIVLLTAVHFHYTGFAAPIITGAVGRMLSHSNSRARPLVRCLAIGVLAGPPLIAIGFVYSPWIQVVAVLWLSSSLAGVSLCALTLLPRMRHGAARGFVIISSFSGLAGMALAACYAVGEFTGHQWLSIPHMARIHGVVNAFGLTLCGLLAWIMEGLES